MIIDDEIARIVAQLQELNIQQTEHTSRLRTVSIQQAQLISRLAALNERRRSLSIQPRQQVEPIPVGIPVTPATPIATVVSDTPQENTIDIDGKVGNKAKLGNRVVIKNPKLLRIYNGVITKITKRPDPSLPRVTIVTRTGATISRAPKKLRFDTSQPR